MRTNLTPETLRKAADLAESISKMQAQLNALLADKVVARASRKSHAKSGNRVVKTKNGQVRHYSPQALKNIAEAQRRRHAAARAAREGQPSQPVAETTAAEATPAA